MSRFCIGEHVYVSSNLHEGRDYDIYVNNEMVSYSGCEAEIVNVREGWHDIYTLKINGEVIDWEWTADMLELNKGDVTMMETVMDKSVVWERDEEFVSNVHKQIEELLPKYGYPVTSEGVDKTLDVHFQNKGWMYDLFSKHPNYNGKGQIIFESDFERPVDEEKLGIFKQWIDKMASKEIKKRQLKVGLFSWEDYYRAMNRYRDIADNLMHGAVYNGMTKEMYRAEYERMKSVVEKICPRRGFTDCRFNGETFYVKDSDYEFKLNILSWADVITSYKNREKANVIDQECATKLDFYADKIGVTTRAVVGQKITKYANKVFVELGFDRDVDMVEKVWIEQNGERRSRMVDMGYNFQKANLGDAITPLTYKRDIVISLNFVDFLTMSFGYKWASCMTIDKENLRGITSNTYEGMYSGGVLSYALDNSTFIVYVRPTERELASVNETDIPFEEQSKFKRCLFMMGEDKLIQSRVYPDGRDGGDNGIAKQIRTLVQQVVSELLNVTNLWKIKGGTDACCSEIITASYARHYKDYANYEDCNVTYLKRDGDNLNHKSITVGHIGICLCCGETHTEERTIVCEDCYDRGYRGRTETCSNCGENFNPNSDDAIVTADGTRFCCSECAENAGYVWACDTDDWRESEYCSYEDYSGDWYYHDGEGIYIDEYWYHNEDTAVEAGNTYCEFDDCWVSNDYATEIGDTGEYYDCREHDSIEAVDGCMFPDEDSAIENGYRHIESQDIWVSEADYDDYATDDDNENIA